jgi:triphosphoribosyl-dephospho-CoA synthetase
MAGSLQDGIIERSKILPSGSGNQHETAQFLRELASETETMLSQRPALSVLQDMRIQWSGELSYIRKSGAQIESYRRQVEELDTALHARETSWPAFPCSARLSHMRG